MREVAVHLQDHVGSVGQRLAEPGQVRGAEPLLPRPVQHGDVGELRGEPVGDLARCRPASCRRSRARGRRARRGAHHRARGSRARCRWGGRRSPARRAISSRRGDDAAAERGRRRPARPAGRPAGARRRGQLSRDRLPARAPRVRETPRRSPSSRSTAGEGAARDRQDDRGEDRPDRRGRRDPRAHEAQGRVPPRSSLFTRLPGLGPEERAQIWQELGITTLDELQAAAEAQQLRDAARARREDRGERPQGARRAGRPPTSRGARCSAGRCRRCRPSPQVLRSIRPPIRSRGRQRAAPPGDRPRPRHHRHRDRPDALIEYFTKLAWVAEVAAKGDDEGDGRLARRPPLRPARRPARELRQPAPALHRLEGPQRRAARGRRAAEALGLRVRRSDVETGEVAHVRERGGALRASSATSTSRPSCARTAASSRPRATGELPKLVELRRPARRPAHAHATGRPTARTRSRRW